MAKKKDRPHPHEAPLDPSPESAAAPKVVGRDLRDEDLTDYVDFVATLSHDNAIAKRFVGATHLLARAVLVSTIFNAMRALDFDWETSAEMTGDMLGMSRSSVARSVREIDRIFAFWNQAGYSVTPLAEISKQVSSITRKRLAEAVAREAGVDDAAIDHEKEQQRRRAGGDGA